MLKKSIFIFLIFFTYCEESNEAETEGEKITERFFDNNQPNSTLIRSLFLQINSDAFFLGGFDKSNEMNPSNRFYKFNINSKTWTRLADAPFPFPAIDGYFGNSSNIIFNNNKIYASSTTGSFNDYNGEPFYNNQYAEYDISSNTWKKFDGFNDAFIDGASLGRGDIITIGDAPHILYYSNNSSNDAAIISLNDKKVTKKFKNAGMADGNGFRVFQYEYGFIEKHIFDSGNGFYEVITDASNSEGLNLLSDSPENNLMRSYYSFWNNFIVASRKNVIYVFDIESKVWENFNIPEAYGADSNAILINIDQEQGLFAIVNKDSDPKVDVGYFNLTSKTFSNIE